MLFMTACASTGGVATPAPAPLKPYSTGTPVPLPTLAGDLVVTVPPAAPSPTPAAYSVKAGDTLGQIAEQFHVSVDLLLQANPGLDPNAMPIGKELRIPAPSGSVPAEATPTPVAVTVQQAACHFIADGSIWCFVLVRNDTDSTVENISATVRLLGPTDESVAEVSTVLPLDVLPPGDALPLAAYFPSGLTAPLRPQIQILTANYILPNDARYLPAEIGNAAATVSWSGLSATVTGDVLLTADASPAKRVWVVGVAYDRLGQVIGLRRWESQDALQPGSKLPFEFLLSSVAGRIDRVEYAVEARP
jgi:hypothetical protein